jgi:hypothetical protein
MTGRDVAERLRAVLLEGTTPPKAALDDVREAERRLNVSLPQDMRQFYECMNGTEQLTDHDHGLVRLWSLDELTTVREELPDDRDYEGIAAAIVFADHLHWSWAYAGLPIATLDSADDNFHVFIIGGAGGRIPIATSFSGFAELILTNDPRLYEHAG